MPISAETPAAASVLAHIPGRGSLPGLLFSPLPKDYCFLFYVGMVASFCVAVAEAAALLWALVARAGSLGRGARRRAPDRSVQALELISLATHLAMYMLCRLLYTMCIS